MKLKVSQEGTLPGNRYELWDGMKRVCVFDKITNVSQYAILFRTAPETATERDELRRENAVLKERVSILIDSVLREDELVVAARKVVIQSIKKEKQNDTLKAENADLLEALTKIDAPINRKGRTGYEQGRNDGWNDAGTIARAGIAKAKRGAT